MVVPENSFLGNTEINTGREGDRHTRVVLLAFSPKVLFSYVILCWFLGYALKILMSSGF